MSESTGPDEAIVGGSVQTGQVGSLEIWGATDALGIWLSQRVAQDSASGGLRLVSRVFQQAQRRERRARYRALQRSLQQARVRSQLLLTLHEQHQKPLNVIASIVGYPTLCQVLERVGEDLTQLVDDYRQVSDLGQPLPKAAAQTAVLALAETLTHPDPGPLHPLRRRSARRHTDSALTDVERASQRFDLAIEADTASSRRARRAARAELLAGAS